VSNDNIIIIIFTYETKLIFISLLLSALRNIEKGLTVMWQHCQPNARRMPSAAEICEGKSERIGWLVAEVFEMFVMRDMRSGRRSVPMMRWYSGVLSHYGIVLNKRTTAPPFTGTDYRDASWNSFRSGTVLACVLHYFCGGGGGGGSGTGLPPMDLGRIYFQPRTASGKLCSFIFFFRCGLLR
jgi:hypothetical protein